MKASSTAYLWASLLLLGSGSMAQKDGECVQTPLVMTIDNVKLPNGFTRRGINVKIGTPEQEFSFLPRWANNNTFVYGPECDQEDSKDDYPDWCMTFRGGFYQPKDSKTSGKTKSDFKPAPEPFDEDTYDFITETINFGHDATFKDFPIARPLNTSKWDLQGYAPQNIIGFGPESTFVKALKDAGRIQSRSWGFYWGQDGEDANDQMPGSFILGGYDKAKTIGKGVTLPLSERSRCDTGLLIRITDIHLNKRVGGDFSIFEHENGGTELACCISPVTPNVMAMPYEPYYKTLANEIDQGDFEFGRTTGLDYWNIVLDPEEDIYDGDITFTLDNDLKIRVPNRQLVLPEKKINDDGEIVSNSSRTVFRINSLQEVSLRTPPYFGRHFLSAAYVVVNEDAGEFTIFQANPTTEEDIRALDEENNELPASATCTSSPTSSGDVDGEDSDNSKSGDGEEDDSGLSTGAVAGIAVGVAVPALAAIAFLVWWLLKRKREKLARADQAHLESTRQYMTQPVDPNKDNPYPNHVTPQLPPQEMATDNQPRRPPVEMPG